MPMASLCSFNDFPVTRMVTKSWWCKRLFTVISWWRGNVEITTIHAMRCVKYSSDVTTVLRHRTSSASLLTLINEGCLLIRCLQGSIYLSVKLAPSPSLVVVISRIMNQASSNYLVLPLSHEGVLPSLSTTRGRKSLSTTPRTK